MHLLLCSITNNQWMVVLFSFDFSLLLHSLKTMLEWGKDDNRKYHNFTWKLGLT